MTIIYNIRFYCDFSVNWPFILAILQVSYLLFLPFVYTFCTIEEIRLCLHLLFACIFHEYQFNCMTLQYSVIVNLIKRTHPYKSRLYSRYTKLYNSEKNHRLLYVYNINLFYGDPFLYKSPMAARRLVQLIAIYGM